jgi:hypothetical protein
MEKRKAEFLNALSDVMAEHGAYLGLDEDGKVFFVFGYENQRDPCYFMIDWDTYLLSASDCLLQAGRMNNESD